MPISSVGTEVLTRSTLSCYLVRPIKKIVVHLICVYSRRVSGSTGRSGPLYRIIMIGLSTKLSNRPVQITTQIAYLRTRRNQINPKAAVAPRRRRVDRRWPRNRCRNNREQDGVDLDEGDSKKLPVFAWRRPRLQGRFKYAGIRSQSTLG